MSLSLIVKCCEQFLHCHTNFSCYLLAEFDFKAKVEAKQQMADGSM